MSGCSNLIKQKVTAAPKSRVEIRDCVLKSGSLQTVLHSAFHRRKTPLVVLLGFLLLARRGSQNVKAGLGLLFASRLGAVILWLSVLTVIVLPS